MSLTTDPAAHLDEPTTPQHTAPAAPAGAAADTEAVASSRALASAVEHSRTGGTTPTAGGGRNVNIDRIKSLATSFAGKVRTDGPRILRQLRDKRSARRR